MDNWEETEAEEQNGECLEEKESSSVPDDKEANQTEQQPLEKLKSSARWDQFYRKIVKPFLIWTFILLIINSCTINTDFFGPLKERLRPYSTFDFVKITSNRPPGTICQIEGNIYYQLGHVTLWNKNVVSFFEDMTFKKLLWQETLPGEIESAKCQYMYPQNNTKINGYYLSVVYKEDLDRKLKCFHIGYEWFEEYYYPNLAPLNDIKFYENEDNLRKQDISNAAIRIVKSLDLPISSHIETICDVPIGTATFIDALSGILLQSQDKKELILLDYKGVETSRHNMGKEFIHGMRYDLDGKQQINVFDGRILYEISLKNGKIAIFLLADTGENGILEKSIISTEIEDKQTLGNVFGLYNGLHTFIGIDRYIDNKTGICNIKTGLQIKKAINNNMLMLEDGSCICIDNFYNKYYPYKFPLIPISCITDFTLTPNKDYLFYLVNEVYSLLCKSYNDGSQYIVTFNGEKMPNMFLQNKIVGVDQQVSTLFVAQKGSKVDFYLANDRSVYRCSMTNDEIRDMKRKKINMEMAEEPIINLNEF